MPSNEELVAEFHDLVQVGNIGLYRDRRNAVLPLKAIEAQKNFWQSLVSLALRRGNGLECQLRWLASRCSRTCCHEPAGLLQQPCGFFHRYCIIRLGCDTFGRSQAIKLEKWTCRHCSRNLRDIKPLAPLGRPKPADGGTDAFNDWVIWPRQGSRPSTAAVPLLA